MSGSGGLTRTDLPLEVPRKNSHGNHHICTEHKEYQPLRLHNVGSTPGSVVHQLTNMESIAPLWYLFLSLPYSLSISSHLFSSHAHLLSASSLSRMLNSGVSYTMRLTYTLTSSLVHNKWLLFCPAISVSYLFNTYSCNVLSVYTKRATYSSFFCKEWYGLVHASSFCANVTFALGANFCKFHLRKHWK